MFFNKKRSPLANLDDISDKTGLDKDAIDLSIRESINKQIEQQVDQDQGAQAEESIKETNNQAVDDIKKKSKPNAGLKFLADTVKSMGNIGSGFENITIPTNKAIDIGQSSNAMDARKQAIMNLLNRK